MEEDKKTEINKDCVKDKNGYVDSTTLFINTLEQDSGANLRITRITF